MKIQDNFNVTCCMGNKIRKFEGDWLGLVWGLKESTSGKIDKNNYSVNHEKIVPEQ
jgi:hypothetical protein